MNANSLHAKILGLMALSLFLGCSSQYRQGTLRLDGQEVLANLTTVSAASGAFSALANDNNTAVYYAEGPNRGLGPAHSVFSINDPTQFGLSFQNGRELESVKIYFLDGSASGQRSFSLSVQGRANGQDFALSFDSYSFEFSNARLTINFNNGGRILQAVTQDLDPNHNRELAGTIQLRFYTRATTHSTPVYEGKISTLVGYQ